MGYLPQGGGIADQHSYGQIEAILMTTKKIFSPENRILILAVFISLLWHLLWMSVIKIVAKPAGYGPLKFSSVAFLGPASGTAPGEFKLTPRALTFLEKRYRDNLMKIAGDEISKNPVAGRYERYNSVTVPAVPNDGLAAYFIEKALERPKPEPNIISD